MTYCNGAPVANKVTQIDNLTYSYEPGSNKLSKVVDASGNLEGFKKGNTTTSADYTYDVFGNLTVDRDKNITKISYNTLHLPVELNIGSNKIAYLYDASGKKV